ncbi:hypothetical protein [Chloroflexus sp.]|uniref:hypothetical protein n=1 Tax=Chloroflexus sp. TaxID=1904827 RepID=UPI00298EEE27|nr:hypothetical protein [Chloroflexus sp.]MDW8403480.1 hypothetical protein [Chloroflexus sp.]
MSLALARWVSTSRPLLKTMVRGGVLRLDANDLTFGEGVLGARNVRSLPLAELDRIEDRSDECGRGMCLVFCRGTTEWLTVKDVNPLAAHRLRALVSVLQEQRCRQRRDESSSNE